MGGLSHYMEEDGLATTQISLVRLHSEIIRPPRALWVPFELGRPFGPPGMADFQTRVLVSVLSLLEKENGPVLADFDEDAPLVAAAEPDGWACPLPPMEREPDEDPEKDLRSRFLGEMASLASWYSAGVRQRGKTAVGASGIAVEDLGGFVAGFLGEDIPVSPKTDVDPFWMLKLAAEDLKAYYLEAATAQPGCADPGGDSWFRWFYNETDAGRVLWALRERLAGLSDPQAQLVGAFLLVPVSETARKSRRKRK